MKAVAETLGVARSNLVEQLQRPKRPQRGPYRRAEDEAVLGEIRTITDWTSPQFDRTPGATVRA